MAHERLLEMFNQKRNMVFVRNVLGFLMSINCRCNIFKTVSSKESPFANTMIGTYTFFAVKQKERNHRCKTSRNLVYM